MNRTCGKLQDSRHHLTGVTKCALLKKKLCDDSENTKQNLKKVSDNVSRTERNMLQFADAYIEGNHLIFSARNVNGLFRCEIGKTDAEFLGHFKDEIIWQKNIHRQIIALGDCLYFIPYTGKGISIYDKKTSVISFVKIREKPQISISRAFLWEEKIYMVPSDLDTPWILFDTSKHNYEILWDLWKSVLSRFSNKTDFIWGVYSSCIYEQKLFLKGEKETILSVDLAFGEIHTYKLPQKYTIRNFFFDKNRCYLILSDRCEIVSWDWHTNSCREYKTDSRSVIYHPYMCMLRWGNHLLLLPDQTDEIWELDEKEEKWHIEKKYIPAGFCREKKIGSLFLGYRIIEDKLLLFPWTGNGMVILTEKGSALQKIYYPDDLAGTYGKIQKQFLEDRLSEGSLLCEDKDEEIDLNNFLAVISDFSKESFFGKENAGERIWNICR